MPDVLACGNCAFYALWHRFPAVVSWSVVFSVWLIALSAVRTAGGVRIPGVPPVYLALPLVLLVWLFAPGIAGPVLGIWIPVCCVIGTSSALTQPAMKHRRVVNGLGLAAASCLLVFGAWDYVRYHQLSPEERGRWQPVWERASRPELESAENALAQVVRAVEQDDVDAFGARVSSPTIRYLRAEHGEQRVEPALSFMMSLMESALPLRVVDRERRGDSTVLTVQGGDWERTELVFVREGGIWKLELEDAYQDWDRLVEWAEDVKKRMEEATPYLGTEGPGGSMLRNE